MLLFYDLPCDCKPVTLRPFLTLYSHRTHECLTELMYGNTPLQGIIL